MKKIFVFTLLFFICVSMAKAGVTTVVPLSDDDPDQKDPKPLSITYLPVTATFDDVELGIYFDYAVGYATIAVYDSADILVDVEIVDTYSTTETFINTAYYDSGDYKLKISYGSKNLIGYFNIP